MEAESTALERYTGGAYRSQHPGWHLEDSPGKAKDLLPGLLPIVDRMGNKTISLADVGAGVGGVLDAVIKELQSARPGIDIDATAIEVSPDAIAEAERLFPQLRTKCKLLEPSDGPFTAIILADVLEHLENPLELMRTARETCQYLVVRQPLLDGFALFRHNGYSHQRNKWGHIGYFNYLSFCDMAASTGWKPLHIELVAPWELRTGKAAAPSIAKRSLVRIGRLYSSYFMSGFYLNGSFERTESEL